MGSGEGLLAIIVFCSLLLLFSQYIKGHVDNLMRIHNWGRQNSPYTLTRQDAAHTESLIFKPFLKMGIFAFFLAIISVIVGIVVVIILFLIKIIKTHKNKKKKPDQNGDRFIEEEKIESSTNPSSDYSEPTSGGYSRSPLGPEFTVRRNHLKESFPAGYEFLCYPKSTSRVGIWMGTVVNAHLYLDNKFLAYIKLMPDSLIFNPKFNGQIAHGTTDCSDLLFPELMNRLIQSHDGYNERWAKQLPNGLIQFTSITLSAFFKDLIKSIESIK
jgi:hypothetical protein